MEVWFLFLISTYIVWWKYIIDDHWVIITFFSSYAQFVYMYENFVVAKITVPQGQINLFIFSFFVRFSASLELDIQGNISLQTKIVNWCGMFVPASISILKTQSTLSGSGLQKNYCRVLLCCWHDTSWLGNWMEWWSLKIHCFTSSVCSGNR